MADDPRRFYALIHPGGPGGVIATEPKMVEQDREALSADAYIVAFFPKLDCLGPANLRWPSTLETLSRSPEAAISKFMDRIAKDEKWETYVDAGHMVRKVRIDDMGPA